jgi:hypothetical protein
MAGAALLVFRLSIAVTIVVNLAESNAPLWAFAIMLVAAIFLSLGFLTPYCAVANCLLAVVDFLVPAGPHGLPLAIFIIDSGVLAVLGPGAYSIDAHIFGRRILIVPPRR